MIFILISESLGHQDGRAAESIARRAWGVHANHHWWEARDVSRIRKVLWKLQGGNGEAPTLRKDAPPLFPITAICLPWTPAPPIQFLEWSLFIHAYSHHSLHLKEQHTLSFPYFSTWLFMATNLSNGVNLLCLWSKNTQQKARTIFSSDSLSNDNNKNNM